MMLGDPQSRGHMLLEYLSLFDIQKRGDYHQILHIWVCDGNKFWYVHNFGILDIELGFFLDEVLRF